MAGDTTAGDTPTEPETPTETAAPILGLPRWVAAILPLVLLALLVGGLFATGPMAALDSGGNPLPDVTVTHATLPNDETLVLHVVNNGPDSVTVSQVLVNDAYWDFTVRGAGGDATIAPMQGAEIVVPYHWQPGWDLGTALLLADGATIHHTIVAPHQSPGLTADLLWTMVVVGVFVGVIPILLGMLWFPFMQTMSRRALHAILAFSAGVLGFLAIDAGFESLELAADVPGAFEGPALVALGVLGALLLVQSISAWRTGKAADGHPAAQRGLWVAYLVAVGIGLHNLAEGLAIGSSFALGRVSLGAFLVVGFMLHNVTEGPAVVAPAARDERPAWWHFGALGLIAGAPVILGGWLGSLAYSPTLGSFFLAVGVGAILQVIWELRGLVAREGRVGTATNLLAFLGGLVVMYATDLLVVL
jgi:zinc transporter ZupT